MMGVQQSEGLQCPTDSSTIFTISEVSDMKQLGELDIISSIDFVSTSPSYFRSDPSYGKGR